MFTLTTYHRRGRCSKLKQNTGHWYSLSALIALLQVGDTGCAVGIEHIKELNDQAIENVKKDSPELLQSERLMLVGRLCYNFKPIFSGSTIYSSYHCIQACMKCTPNWY